LNRLRLPLRYGKTVDNIYVVFYFGIDVLGSPAPIEIFTTMKAFFKWGKVARFGGEQVTSGGPIRKRLFY
jgi:hypothetical protein